MNDEHFEKVGTDAGFIAALDQSGGSTPKALKLYGIDETEYDDEEEMFDLMHAARVRIMTSPVFGGDRVLGAILFEGTMDRDVEGQGAASYLWDVKRVVPFVKVDQGLASESGGVQLMKPIVGLEDLLRRAADKGVFGTKMRSVIKLANEEGIRAIADQQFEVAQQIIDHGLMPIIEPEVDIHSAEKAAAEGFLKREIVRHLNNQKSPVMLKLSLPTVDGFYRELLEHPNVLRVVALSGGYDHEDANAILCRNPGVIASFSRALTEGLSASQTDEDFDATLDASIGDIYSASSSSSVNAPE